MALSFAGDFFDTCRFGKMLKQIDVRSCSVHSVIPSLAAMIKTNESDPVILNPFGPATFDVALFSFTWNVLENELLFFLRY